MGFIIGGIIIFVFAMILLIMGLLLRYTEMDTDFATNGRVGRAEVVGYDGTSANSSQLLVRVFELNDGKIYNCPIKNATTYPLGAIIDVRYAPKMANGIYAIAVRSRYNTPLTSIQKRGCGLLILSGVLFVVGTVLVSA